MKNFAAILGAASLALSLSVTPAHAGGDITNFNVRNCTDERIFVCSFDKTDSDMTIPYKARRIQPQEKKEFGCASLNRCKVIIGVSKKTANKTLSSGMEAGMSTGAVSGGAVVGLSAATYISLTALGGGTAIAVTGGVAGVILAVGLGTTVAGLEIKDGWKDGDVCNEVRKAAQKAGIKPKSFMRDGKAYQVIPKYATNKDGNPYVNADGTAVFAYTTESDRGQCPNALAKQLVKD